jgi:hypothetical protein
MADPTAFRQRAVAGAPAFLLAVAVILALAAPSGCSSGSASAGCDAARCASGNECIDDGSGSGPACHKVCTSSADCPFNWSCNDNPSKSWCVLSSYAVPELPTGQWGTACRPGDGEQGNKACDLADQFACYGINPTDANAFCTIFGCSFDTDCPGGWWCATVNAAPNVRTNKPSFGPTRTACLPRAYCAPCRMDHDCPPASDGTQQHCVKEAQGDSHCAPQCGSDANCALDAKCANWQSLCTPAQGPSCRSDDDCPLAGGITQHCDSGRCSPECGGDGDCASVGDAGAAPATCTWRRVCAPRAGVCLGGGGFCAPCRSDKDCMNGYCLSGMPYSTERFCSLKSTTLPCDTTTLDPPGCPRSTSGDNWLHSGCTSTPPSQCEGLVTFGTATGQAAGVPGCWTVNR